MDAHEASCDRSLTPIKPKCSYADLQDKYKEKAYYKIILLDHDYENNDNHNILINVYLLSGFYMPHDESLLLFNLNFLCVCYMTNGLYHLTSSNVFLKYIDFSILHNT